MQEELQYSKTKRLKNQILNVVKNPYNIIVLIAVILLTLLIVVPLLDMVRETFTLARSDVRRVDGGVAGQFTLFYWNRVLASDLSKSLLWIPLRNSLMIGLIVSVLSITLGALFAWLLVRTDLPGKKLLSLLVIVPYMIPSWCKSQAWLTVFKNSRVGGASGFLEFLGLQIPDWLAYGPFAIICVLTLHYYAYAYLLVSSALSSINSELEEMGEICGANKATILRRITLPLVLPAMLSAFILTFSKSIGTFGVPAYLGLKVHYYTISTMLYSSINQGNTETAYALALILIGIAALTVYMNQRAIGSRKSYATIGGKGGRSSLLSLGIGKPILLTAMLVFFAVGIILPIVVLVLQTFMLRSGDYSLSNMTLYYWIGDGTDKSIMEGIPGVFRNPAFMSALINSLKLTFITAIFGTVFGQCLGYISARGRGTLHGRLVEQLVFIPYLIPSIAFGAIYLSMFSVPHGPFPSLYGTFALIVLVSVVKHLPFASRAGTSNMLQISKELEEAASIEGAGFFKRFFKIVFPLSKGGFLSGFMLIFISIMKELDLIIILMSPQNKTLPYLAYEYSTNNFPQASNAVAVVMFLIVFVIYAAANLFGDADISKSMGG